MPSTIPSGNKSNTTFFIRRTHFELGPGSLVDDKQPYTGGKHGARVYAYQLRYNQFKRAISENISQRKGSFTYKKDGQTHFCNENWIILWQAYISQVNNNAELRRSVTYFVTQNPDYLWMNKIALVEYTGIDNQECQNPLRKVRRKFRPDREKGVNPRRKQTGINEALEEYTGIDDQECQHHIRAVGLDRDQRVNPGSKQNGSNGGAQEYTEIAEKDCHKHIGVIEQNFRPKRDKGVNLGSKQTGIAEDLQEYSVIHDTESQNHLLEVRQHFRPNWDSRVNFVSKQPGIDEDAQEYTGIDDRDCQNPIRVVGQHVRPDRVHGVNSVPKRTGIKEEAQEYTGIDDGECHNHLREREQNLRTDKDQGVDPGSKQTEIIEDAEREGKYKSENSCKNCIIYLKSYFETSEENKRLKACIEKWKKNQQIECNRYQEEIRNLKDKLKSSQNIPVNEEARFSSESSNVTKNISNKPVFAVHERKKDYYCYVCKINFQTKATLDFHIQSLHEKKKSGKLYFASKRKSVEIRKTPIVFPLAKKSKENISAEHSMTENSTGKNKIIYKRQQMADNFERKIENKDWDQNQNSCFDCKKNFSSRQDLKQHNNIHLGTKMFHCPAEDCKMAFCAGCT